MDRTPAHVLDCDRPVAGQLSTQLVDERAAQWKYVEHRRKSDDADQAFGPERNARIVEATKTTRCRRHRSSPRGLSRGQPPQPWCGSCMACTDRKSEWRAGYLYPGTHSHYRDWSR